MSRVCPDMLRPCLAANQENNRGLFRASIIARFANFHWMPQSTSGVGNRPKCRLVTARCAPPRHPLKRV
jgi:hypothetical protein